MIENTLERIATALEAIAVTLREQADSDTDNTTDTTDTADTTTTKTTKTIRHRRVQVHAKTATSRRALDSFATSQRIPLHGARSRPRSAT